MATGVHKGVYHLRPLWGFMDILTAQHLLSPVVVFGEIQASGSLPASCVSPACAGEGACADACACVCGYSFPTTAARASASASARACTRACTPASLYYQSTLLLCYYPDAQPCRYFQWWPTNFTSISDNGLASPLRPTEYLLRLSNSPSRIHDCRQASRNSEFRVIALFSSLFWLDPNIQKKKFLRQTRVPPIFRSATSTLPAPSISTPSPVSSLIRPASRQSVTKLAAWPRTAQPAAVHVDLIVRVTAPRGRGEASSTRLLPVLVDRPIPIFH
ncbi:hypothetical protein BKA56DRAFT_625067 [Ilyonectria sp. MPI-CAGE-AT-0026]|nr:hypothetical protein BKA56DRAFT_625067 [Ilyonectria sp. MPI-CAGE-AT-0026]